MNTVPARDDHTDVGGPPAEPSPAVPAADHAGVARRGRRWWRIVAGVAVVLLVAGGAGSVWVSRQLNPPGGPGAVVGVDIPKGATTRRIAAILEADGVVTSARVFELYARFRGSGPWQAGHYVLRRRLRMGDVVRLLDRGPAIDYSRLTIPEGLTLEQIAARVAKLPGRSAATFLALARNGSVRSRYEPAGVDNLEGLLFPDTYVIDEKDDEATILRRLVGAFEDQADQAGLAGAAAAVGVSPYQALVVASMVEREAKVAEDRGRVARVIYNRLARGMRLGIDATIRYGLDKPSGPLLQSELDRDSPYNTRTRAGLPPTPIASPGRASLDAALHPTPGPWLYYVIADAQGHHAFVVTPAEFERAKAEARRKGLL